VDAARPNKTGHFNVLLKVPAPRQCSASNTLYETIEGKNLHGPPLVDSPATASNVNELVADGHIQESAPVRLPVAHEEILATVLDCCDKFGRHVHAPGQRALLHRLHHVHARAEELVARLRAPTAQC
jgi:hypothetical protein